MTTVAAKPTGTTTPANPTYIVSIRKTTILGRLEVTVYPRNTQNSFQEDAKTQRMQAAAKEAFGRIISKQIGAYIEFEEANEEFRIQKAELVDRSVPIFSMDHKPIPMQASIQQGFFASLRRLTPTNVIQLLEGRNRLTYDPISAVRAVYDYLPEKKKSLASLKRDLIHFVKNNSKVNEGRLRQELVAAYTSGERFDSLACSDAKKKRLFTLLETPATFMTTEDKKLIREAYADYINREGIYLGEYFLCIVNMALPIHTIFVKSESAISCISQNPEKASAFHSVFLYKNPNQPGYDCYSRDGVLSDKTVTLRCPGTSVPA